ncbi:MAG: hypothetical protein J5802_00790 [Butyrivibrio sp.]|nr:hypothetical protein [Butyrivibrio sp.]
MRFYGFNHEGYSDPTALEAISNVTRWEKKRRLRKGQRAPDAGDMKENYKEKTKENN